MRAVSRSSLIRSGAGATGARSDPGIVVDMAILSYPLDTKGGAASLMGYARGCPWRSASEGMCEASKVVGVNVEAEGSILRRLEVGEGERVGRPRWFSASACISMC